MYAVDGGELASLRLLELPVPALELARDVVLLLGEIAEADRIDVDGVKVGEHVDERFAGASALRLGERLLGDLGVVQHHAGNEPHHVERARR